MTLYIQLYLRCLSDEGDHESVVEATVISTTVKGPDTCTMNAYMYTCTCTCTCTYTCSSTCTCLEKDEDQYVMAVYNRWTGLVDWTSGLDYWTDLFTSETQI